MHQVKQKTSNKGSVKGEVKLQSKKKEMLTVKNKESYGSAEAERGVQVDHQKTLTKRQVNNAH